MPDAGGIRDQRGPVVDFDHHRPVAERDPDDVYRELRETCPVAWSEHHGGFWVVSSYEHVAEIFKDPTRFSSSHNLVVPYGVWSSIPPTPLGAHIPEELDPPEFQAYRRLFNAVLSPAQVAELRPRIQYWATQCIDGFIERGEADLVEELAAPLPASVTLEWIGIPQEHWRRIGDAFHTMASLPYEDPRSHAAFADLAWLDQLIAEEVRDRRSNPRDDLISYFANARIDGRPISDEYVEGMIRLVIGGGVETTTSAIGATLLHLARHPDHRRRLIDDPELWTTAGEEFLRRYPPIRTHARTVVDDTLIGGCLMRAGDRVLVSEGSACHDEVAFPEADQVDLERFPNRHLAFGLGIHRCAGMHLARLELEEVVKQVLRRLPDYTIDDEQVTRYPHQPMASGYASIIARFTPGPVVSDMSVQTS